MKQTFLCHAMLACVLLTACNSESSSVDENKDTTNKTVANQAPGTTANQPVNTPAATANDAAIAVIENSNVRFKLHSLSEVTPDPAAPGKPADGKKIYAADISAEYLTAHNTSAAEYMLNSYIVDDKGNRHSLPMGSARLAMVVSEAQAQQDNAAGEAFNQSNPPSGQTFRGRQYGIEMDAGNKPVKWGMRLDGKEVEVAIRQ